ncbi:hypothetical protein [uncultured Thiocystis sp.]|uniref:hypothetical protein n=1 Tax=uncultured Thiocystis sp. TaxID=1202134 RepID=UPI0025E14A1F|nr:hypothetical protein [uncultured Thiocystis sp.]
MAMRGRTIPETDGLRRALLTPVVFQAVSAQALPVGCGELMNRIRDVDWKTSPSSNSIMEKRCEQMDSRA